MFSRHLDLSCRWLNDKHVKNEKSGSSQRAFHVNEPFYRNGGYKSNKVIKIFLKKKQIYEVIRVKSLLILKLRNKKVTFIVLYVKYVSKSVP